jgi:uncharacterized Ntn-hydrolase superfamily protein
MGKSPDVGAIVPFLMSAVLAVGTTEMDAPSKGSGELSRIIFASDPV